MYFQNVLTGWNYKNYGFAEKMMKMCLDMFAFVGFLMFPRCKHSKWSVNGFPRCSGSASMNTVWFGRITGPITPPFGKFLISKRTNDITVIKRKNPLWKGFYIYFIASKELVDNTISRNCDYKLVYNTIVPFL